MTKHDKLCAKVVFVLFAAAATVYFSFQYLVY